MLKDLKEIVLNIHTLKTRGLTFSSLLKLNACCIAPVFAIIFILAAIANIFMEPSVSSTGHGLEITGWPAVGMLIVVYPIFVFGFSLCLSIFMKLGQFIYTKFKSINLSFITDIEKA